MIYMKKKYKNLKNPKEEFSQHDSRYAISTSWTGKPNRTSLMFDSIGVRLLDLLLF